MKKQSIFRTSDKKGAKGYTPITNKILQSKEMTLDEVGLLVYLLSLPKNFKVLKVSIQSMVSDRISNGRFDQAWKSLKNRGHLVLNSEKEKNLKRSSWCVYETPEFQDTQNQDSRKTPIIQSTHLESTQVKSNNLESTINNINTGARILEEKVETKSDPSFFFEEAKMEAIQYLIGATILGEEILKYSGIEQQDELLSRVGNIQFEVIAPQLQKLYFATQQLVKLKSSSTEGFATPQPT